MVDITRLGKRADLVRGWHYEILFHLCLPSLQLSSSSRSFVFYRLALLCFQSHCLLSSSFVCYTNWLFSHQIYSWHDSIYLTRQNSHYFLHNLRFFVLTLIIVRFDLRTRISSNLLVCTHETFPTKSFSGQATFLFTSRQTLAQIWKYFPVFLI